RRLLQRKINQDQATWAYPLRFLRSNEGGIQLDILPIPLSSYMKTATIKGFRLPDLRPKIVRRRLNDYKADNENDDIPADFWFYFWKSGLDNKEKVIWWKLAHKRIPTRKWLHKVFPLKCDSEICQICNEEIEDIEHFFFSCPTKKK